MNNPCHKNAFLLLETNEKLELSSCKAVSWIHFQFSYTGCPEENDTPFLLDISATKYRIFKTIFSPENWYPYARVEYSNIFEQFLGAEMFAKQNGILD